MISFLKGELNGFSGWFKRLFFISFCIYVLVWGFTIYLSEVQKKNELEPILPVATMDSTEYRNLAESLLKGEGFAQNNIPDTLIAPGYPSLVAFIKYITRSYFVVTFIQIILVFISSIFIRRIGKEFYSQFGGEIASIFFILNPVTITLTLSVMTDILFLFLLTLGFYLAYFLSLSKPKIFYVSIVFAAAIYVRPMGVFALPIFALPFLIKNISWKEKFRSLVILVAVILIAALPWVYRNYKLTGVADFSSFRSANLGLYAAPLFLSSINHTGLDFEKEKISESIGVPISKFRDLTYSKEVSTAALKIILANPFSYIKYHLTSSVSFLFSSSIQYMFETYRQAMHLPNVLESGAMSHLIAGDFEAFLKSIVKVWWKFAERLVWLLIYLIALVGVWWERNKKVTWAFLFIVLYFMLLAGPVGNARYAIQSLPYKLLLFVAGLDFISSKFRNKNKNV